MFYQFRSADSPSSCLRRRALAAKITGQAQHHTAPNYSESSGEFTMWDIGCIVASVAFFLAAIAYTTGCERLGLKESK
jgi:hypothetical protein